MQKYKRAGRGSFKALLCLPPFFTDAPLEPIHTGLALRARLKTIEHEASGRTPKPCQGQREPPGALENHVLLLSNS